MEILRAMCLPNSLKTVKACLSSQWVTKGPPNAGKITLWGLAVKVNLGQWIEHRFSKSTVPVVKPFTSALSENADACQTIAGNLALFALEKKFLFSLRTGNTCALCFLVAEAQTGRSSVMECLCSHKEKTGSR